MSHKRAPPKRSIPSGPGTKPNNDTVVKKLQAMVTERNGKIKTLTEQIQTLTVDKNKLQRRVETLEQSLAAAKKREKAAENASKSKSSSGGGVSSGVSQGDAANALAAKLGGHIKHKKSAESKGGVETGMNQDDAKNKLAGLFGAKKKPPSSGGGGGVDSGPSQKGAAAALGALMMKKPPSPSSTAPSKPSGGNSGGGGGSYAQYKAQFKKYEIMIKIGQSVYSAVGRMRQDGVDSKLIAIFEKQHGAFADEEEKVDPKSLGLREKKEVPVSKGIKMKRLHWEPTDIKTVKGSIWEDLDESKIKYDHKHFELHFQVRQRKPMDEQKAAKGANAKNGETITFVAAKRQQPILIGLTNLKMSNEELRTKLHQMDEKVMTVDTLSKLLEIVPSPDEQMEAERKIMQEGTRNAKDYGVAEQFYFGLYDFYNLQQRLKLWMFKQNFKEICDSLMSQYKTIGMACDKVRNNKNLKLLLTIILTFGNHMNSGTRKGQIYGFDLKILTAMTGVKSFDNTRSLLMYIYEFCDRKYPNALKVLDELTNVVKAASSMETETLSQAFGRIKDNMTTIKNLVTSDEIENYDLDDQFLIVMGRFHKEADKGMKKFNMTVQNVMTSTKRVMKKYSFGTEESPQTIETFFATWRDFFEDFRGAKEKLITLEKERQKRIAARKRKKEKEKRRQLHQQYSTRHLGAKEDDEKTELAKGTNLYREFEKRQKFEAAKGKLHGKLSGHVKKKSIFVQNGGKLDGQTQNDTMRRLSSMYQNDMDQVKALEAARKKARTLEYNKFRLPEPKHNPAKWTNNRRFTDTNFQPPDEKKMLKPMKQIRNTHQTANKQLNKKVLPKNPAPNKGGVPSPRSKPTNKPTVNAKVKQKQHQGNTQHNGVRGQNPASFPPPPKGPAPANAVPMQYQAMNNYGSNPQATWQQQQQQPLGYGSSPNLSYQFVQQNNMGNAMYGQQHQPQQGQYRPNQMQPMPNQYHSPYKYNNQQH